MVAWQRRGAWIACCAVLLGLVPAAAAKSSQSATVLGGSNTFTVTRSAAFSVVVPQNARLTVAKSRPGMRLAGSGRIIAAALHATDDDGTRAVAVSKHVICVPAGCKPDPRLAPHYFTPLAVGFESAGADTVLIPRGRYTLSVSTDGSPVTVALELAGLSGRSRSSGGKATDTRPVEAGPASVSAASGHTSALAETGVTASAAFIAYHSHATSAVHVTAASGKCLYGPDRPPNGLITTQCPGGYAPPQFVTTYATLDYAEFNYGAVIIRSTEPAPFAVGGFYTGAHAVSDLKMLALAIPLHV